MLQAFAHFIEHSDSGFKQRPSWYLIATEDKMIPPPAQRQMATRAGATIAEAAGSHAICLEAGVVAALIAKAAKSVTSEMAVD